jgi:hypothetical protein
MKQKQTAQLQTASLGVARIRFLFVAIFVVFVIAADAWNLIPPGAALERWTLAGVVLGANAVLWYGSRISSKSPLYYKGLLYLQIILDIAVATFLVYAERGIASKSILLYMLPIATSAALASRSALYATATLCAAVYGMTVVRYQFLHPGEAYKIELYATLLFYGALFMMIAAVLSVVLRTKRTS